MQLVLDRLNIESQGWFNFDNGLAAKLVQARGFASIVQAQNEEANLPFLLLNLYHDAARKQNIFWNVVVEREREREHRARSDKGGCALGSQVA